MAYLFNELKGGQQLCKHMQFRTHLIQLMWGIGRDSDITGYREYHSPGGELWWDMNPTGAWLTRIDVIVK